MHDLLVHIDSTDVGRARGECARAIAQALGLKLRALIVACQPVTPYGPGADSMAGVFEGVWEAVRQEAHAAETWARDALGADTMLLSALADRLALDAASVLRSADIALVGPPLRKHSFIDDDLFQAALFMSGRPIIMIPPAAKPPRTLKHVVVAWKDARETARAIFDALPILQQAGAVELIAVKEHPESFPVGADARTRMADALRARGVNASTRAIAAEPDGVGATVLAQAATADLLVMGGYGRWRVSELLFGGVTQHLIAHATLPVFMSR